MKTPTPFPELPSIEDLVEATLAAIGRMLQAAGDSPTTREQRARLWTYERVVKRWITIPPSPEQRDAAFDLAIELHASVTEAHRAASTRDPGVTPGAPRAGRKISSGSFPAAG